jgi:hypothetical protein
VSEVASDCLLEFDADGDFVRGFEAGRFWTQLQESDHNELIGQPLHAANAEMILRMGESLGLVIAAEPIDETWITITGIDPVPKDSPDA